MTADHNPRTLARRKRLTWLGIIIGLILLVYELSAVTIDTRLLADDTVEYWAPRRHGERSCWPRRTSGSTRRRGRFTVMFQIFG